MQVHIYGQSLSPSAHLSLPQPRPLRHFSHPCTTAQPFDLSRGLPAPLPAPRTPPLVAPAGVVLLCVRHCRRSLRLQWLSTAQHRTCWPRWRGALTHTSAGEHEGLVCTDYEPWRWLPAVCCAWWRTGCCSMATAHMTTVCVVSTGTGCYFHGHSPQSVPVGNGHASSNLCQVQQACRVVLWAVALVRGNTSHVQTGLRG